MNFEKYSVIIMLDIEEKRYRERITKGTVMNKIDLPFFYADILTTTFEYLN